MLDEVSGLPRPRWHAVRCAESGLEIIRRAHTYMLQFQLASRVIQSDASFIPFQSQKMGPERPYLREV